MSSRNDVTGDAIATRTTSDEYRSGWDRIFGKKKEVINKNIIPKMVHPDSVGWKQPNPDNFKIDDSFATMSRKDFDELKDYTYSNPSGVYVGKVWKAFLAGRTWSLRWYGHHEDLNSCSINCRTIVVVD
jgi:hypothetical protein